MRNETTGGKPLPVYDNRATSTAVASPVQGAASASDVCAEMRVMCSNCGGTGDVTRADGEWLGRCTCPYGASGAKGDLAAALAEVAWNAVRDAGGRPDKIEERIRAALADRSPAVQPSGVVRDAVEKAANIMFQWAGLSDPEQQRKCYKQIMALATPAPEQEAAPQSNEGHKCDFSCNHDEQEAAQVGAKADPEGQFAQGMLAELARMGASPAGLSLAVQLFGVAPCSECGYRKLYCRCTAPVPATTPAEQPEGDSSRVAGSAKGSK